QAAAAAAAASTTRTAATSSTTAEAQRGTVYGGGSEEPPPHGAANGRPMRALQRLRIGSHVITESDMGKLRVSASGTGMLLGRDRQEKPVIVRFFRPEPTRATSVGGIWLARLVAFRALALGARIVLFTSRPAAWERFGRWATGRDDRVAVMPQERPVAVEASAAVPALLIYDVGLLGASARPVLGPWQTQLTVLNQLTAYGFPAVQESNLVAMQRLSGDEAFAAASVLRLTGETPQLLQVLRDDMIALIGGGADRYVWTQPSDIERSQFGAPTR
ncbi:MAG: hypothetical protein WCA46_31560, partial [Actinocatenispora sp.]